MKPSFYHLAFELSPRDPAEAVTPTTEPQLPDDFYPTLSFRPFHDTVRPVSPQPLPEIRSRRAGFSPERRSALQRRHPTNQSRRSSSDMVAASAQSSGMHTMASNPRSDNSGVKQDWRFGKVSVDSIDMEDSSPKTQGKQAETSAHFGDHDRGVAGLSLKGKYVPSSSKSSDLGWGVVHLYRDIEPSDEVSYSVAARLLSGENTGDEQSSSIKDCTTLCLLAVPTYMTPADLLGWLGEGTREEVSHFRLVRTGRTNKYMVLLKFREAKAAVQWQALWDCKPFNSTEPENCRVVFVKSLQFQSYDSRRSPSSFPNMDNDPFMPSSMHDDNQYSARTSTPLTSKPAPPPTPSLVELPTCPVCLERMDDTSGLATIFCQHVFHCACLQKWRGSGCPVCRYTQHDTPQGLKGKTDPQKQTECRVCGTTANPWICLICGHVGCGRYEEAHARAHFEETSHSFAMDISTQHIWDYVGDEYVHRLIQSKADGALVELPSAASGTRQGDYDDGYPKDKMENMSLEYASMLTGQLDNQRRYFEEQVDRAVDKASKATVAAESAAQAAQQALRQSAAAQSSYDALKHEQIPALERDKERAERRADKFEALARKMQKEWREKDVINDSLMERIRHLEAQLGELTLKNSDLEEQNRDLGFFISSSEKLRGQGEEIQEGTVTVAEAPPPAGKRKGRGKK